jgi:hypothetical protein
MSLSFIWELNSMNTLAKVGVASALALGIGVAHASILDTNSGGDILLFGEVLNGSTVVGSYAGDSGVLIGTALTNGQTLISAASDARLASFIASASAGTTIEWAVEGGKTNSSGAAWTSTDQYVTTLGGGGNVAQLALRNGSNASNWESGLNKVINQVDLNGAGPTNNSVFSAALATGGLWDINDPTGSNVANWFANGSATQQTGYSSTTLYTMTMGALITNNVSVSSLGTVTLSSTGLTFTSGSTSVPLPAALWLLGSGLLGLAGVGRRKSAAV